MVVGGEAEAREAARFWRFIPQAWAKFVDTPDPRAIMRQAEASISDEQVMQQWVISADPDEHARSVQQLIDGGVTHIYIHSGQPDQRRVIDFYGREVLPRLRAVEPGRKPCSGAAPSR